MDNKQNFFTMDLSSKTSSAEYFRIKKDGTYSIRIITTPEKYYKDYSTETISKKSFDWFEKASQKFLCHVIDRTDGKIKLYDMPKKITSIIQAFAKEGDFTFNSFPMPYDINITVSKAGTTEVSYAVTPRKETKLTKEEQDEIAKLQTPFEILEKMIGKKSEPVSKSNKVVVDETVDPIWTDDDGSVKQPPF